MNSQEALDIDFPANHHDLRKNRILALLLYAKFTERFIYYGWRSIIILFLINQNTESSSITQETILATFGTVMGSMVFFNLMGSFLGDRFSQSNIICIVGFSLTVIGSVFTLFFSNVYFYIPMLLIASGIGVVSSNISALIGKLFFLEDKKLAAGFTGSFLVVNLGAFTSSIVLAMFTTKFGYPAGFIFLSLAAILPLTLLFAKRQSFNKIESNTLRHTVSYSNNYVHIAILIACAFCMYFVYEIANNIAKNHFADIQDVMSPAIFQFIEFVVGFIALISLIFYSLYTKKSLIKLFVASIGCLQLYIFGWFFYSPTIQQGSYYLFALTILFSFAESIISPLAQVFLIKLRVRYIATSLALLTSASGLAGEFVTFTSNNDWIPLTTSSIIVASLPLAAFGYLIFKKQQSFAMVE